jgi:hypothetical protein
VLALDPITPSSKKDALAWLCLAALAVCLLPWPHSRACAEASLLAAETEAALGSLAALLCRSYGEGARSRGAARAFAARAGNASTPNASSAAAPDGNVILVILASLG